MFRNTRAVLPALLLCTAASAQAVPLLSENFDSVAGLAGAGWVFTNASAPVGESWFQGNSGVFAAQAGAPDAYAAASFLSTAAGGGSISNWLITPEISLATELSVTFWTRTELADGFADSLELRLSTAGASSALSDLSTVVLAINPGLAEGGYPSDWTQITVNVAGQGAGASGRLAFHYALPNNTDYANYVGIDTFSVTAVPETSTYALMALGLAGLAGFARARRRAGAAAAVAAAALVAGPALAATLVKDPDTGRLRAPTAAEYKALKAKADQQRAARAAKGQPVTETGKEVVRPDGSAYIKMGEDSRAFSVMTRGADGSTRLQCVTGEETANKLVKSDKLAAKATTIKTTEGHGHDHQ